MRSAPWCALFCAACIRLAAAQGEASGGEAITFEEPQPVNITGFALATGSYDHAMGRSSFAAGKIAVALFKPIGDAYLFGQLTTALEGGEPATEIDNLIVSWTPAHANRWTLAAGRFDAPIGFERDDEPLNLIPTNSFNFEFARPSKLSGAIVRYTASPTLQLSAALANGWDITVDNNKGKTGLLRAEWIAATGLTIGLTGVYGPERDSIAGMQRTLVSSDITFQRGPAILGVELNLGKEQDGMGGSSRFVGGAATGFWRLGTRVGLSARYDHLDDTHAVLTGIPQVLRSFTVGPMWFYRSARTGIFSNIEHTTFNLPQIAFRTALRFDASSVDYFPNSTGALVNSNTSVVLELLYLF